MRKTFFCIVLPLLVLAACSTPPYHIEQGRQVPRDFFGMAPARDELIPRAFAQLDELGVVWQRRTCRWSAIEPAQGQFDFSIWDAYVDDSKAAGKKLLAILAYDTPWVHGKAKDPLTKISSKELPHFINFVEKVVGRYKGRIDAWEIWNEPDLSKWQGTRKEFFALTIAAAKKVREIDPGAKIVAGAFSRVPASWIKDLFKSGAMDYVDAISFHPYGYNPKGVMELCGEMREILDDFNYKGELWATEAGFPTKGWYPNKTSEKNSPRDIVKILAGIAARDIRVMLWYEFKDKFPKGQIPTPWDHVESEHFFGLADINGVPKKGYYAWGLCARQLAGSEYVPALPRRAGLEDRTVTMCYRKPAGAGFEYTLFVWNERGGDFKARFSLPGEDRKNYDISTGEYALIEDGAELTVGKWPLVITWNAPGIAGPEIFMVSTK